MGLALVTIFGIFCLIPFGIGIFEYFANKKLNKNIWKKNLLKNIENIFLNTLFIIIKINYSFILK